MSTTIKIKPVESGFPKRNAVEIEINAFMVLGDKTSNTHWSIRDEKGEVLESKNCPIPEEIHSQWGTDDSVIQDYVLEQLGLERL